MGIGETVKGAVKESVGKATGNDELAQEGSAQQEKGNAEAAESAHKLKAQEAEKQADALEEQAKSL